ncbi:MAG: rod shape-determining protein MreC [Deltaproteobacteria bacterium]|nr:rod shape-determining protein MreC [Deltaproteobacteria bacterium]MBW2359791.1 rod shape-determining protein MreC [Deltaproteobacteria bacterium]
MVETHNRVRLTLLVVALVGFATVTMVVDRGALRGRARDLPPWAGPLLDIAVPLQKSLAYPVDFVRERWDRYVALIGVQEVNSELRSQLARLQEENLQLREGLVASGRLARISEMRAGFEVPMLPAELVGSDVSPWFRSVLLDRGRADGVLSGMTVISENGLAGLVVSTSNHASKAMLLLDRQTAVDGTVQRSRARGIVRGGSDEALLFEFVARGADVLPGDMVMTSGLDGVHPKGLLVGTVKSVAEAGTDLLRTAVLEPAVDFGRLEQVFVMLRRGPTLELLYSSQTGDTAADVAEAAP